MVLWAGGRARWCCGLEIGRWCCGLEIGRDDAVGWR